MATINKLHNEPIIIATYTKDQLPAEAINEVIQYTAQLLEEIDGVIYCIEDLTEADMTFGNAVQAMAAVTKKQPGSARDPRVKMLLVGSGSLLDVCAKAFRQLQYGELQIPLYSSIEEALADAREMIAAAE
jgi:hypothetical protein